MLTVITGGSGSGKSEFAEGYVLDLGEKSNYYVATMEPWGKEGEARVRRHRSLRSGKPFVTVECFRDVGKLDFCGEGAVLLECLSNLTANEMFGGGEHKTAKEYVRKLMGDLERLERSCRHLVIVTNEVFSDGIGYDAGTEEYRKVLGRVNHCLGRRAGEVLEVVAGLGVYQKRREA